MSKPSDPNEPVISSQQDAAEALAGWFSDPKTRPEDTGDMVAEMLRRKRENKK